MLHEMNVGTNVISIAGTTLSCYGYSQLSPPSFLDSVKILFQSSIGEVNFSVLNLHWTALTRIQMIGLFQERCPNKSLPGLQQKGDLEVASLLGANIRKSPDFLKQFGKASKFECAIFGFSIETPLDCTWSLVDVPDTWVDTARLRQFINRVMEPRKPATTKSSDNNMILTKLDRVVKEKSHLEQAGMENHTANSGRKEVMKAQDKWMTDRPISSVSTIKSKETCNTEKELGTQVTEPEIGVMLEN